MQIAINHLTRMQLGYICVAGVDMQTGRHVRPVMKSRLGIDLLARHGGMFEMATVVDLGPTLYAGQTPEIEDFRFGPRHARRVRDLSASEFWSLLTRQAKDSLTELFGPELQMRGPRSCGTEPGCGLASLGCLRPRRCGQLHVQQRHERGPVVRLDVHDAVFDLDLSVTDIRLYGEDHVAVDEKQLAWANARLDAGTAVILSVGLTRPTTPKANVQSLHWLQVNNLHFADTPLWRLG
jgi:hypothetical protein